MQWEEPMPPPSNSSEMEEVRFKVPRWAFDVLYSRGHANSRSHHAEAAHLVVAWARDELHAMKVLARMARGKGNSDGEYGTLPDDYGN